MNQAPEKITPGKINPDQITPEPFTGQFAPLPQAPTPAVASSRAQELLLEFLRDHDAPCPLCGYNLRSLIRPVCPECGQDLVLAIGAARLRLGWLMAAVAPGFFSGIAAIFTLVPIVARVVIGDGRMSWQLVPLDLFGWCSGIFAITLAARRHRFLALSRAAQRWWALGIWFVHVGALGLFLLIAFMYF